MTYTVLVLDRGRPISKHLHLDLDISQELLEAYRAIGWPEEKLVLKEEDPEDAEHRAAA